MAKTNSNFTIETDPVTQTQFVQLTQLGHKTVVQLANIFKPSMPNPSWVLQNDSKAFGAVINYTSPNSGKRLKDVFNEETLNGKTLASTIAGEVVTMLSLNPVAPQDDPLANI